MKYQIHCLRKTVLLFFGCVLVASCVLIAGCSSRQEEDVLQGDPAFKIMYADDRTFFSAYGDLFSMRHPDIDIKVVSDLGLYDEGKDPIQSMKEYVDREQPDVIVLNTQQYEHFAKEGLILDLEPLIQRDHYDIAGIYPGVLDILKFLGNDKLYGFSPDFYSDAILFNREIFKKYGVDEPTGPLTWDEIFALAARFPADGDETTRIFGYDEQYSLSSGISNYLHAVSRTEGLSWVNTDTMTVTVETDSWKEVFELAVDALKSGALPAAGENELSPDMSNYFARKLFLNGRAAMTTGSIFFFYEMEEADKLLKNFKKFEVGIVPGPVSSLERDKTTGIMMNEIFAINAASANVDAAWEFIKFAAGDELAKIKSRRVSSSLLARTGYSTDFNGQSMEMFYSLKPVLRSTLDDSKIPAGFNGPFSELLNRELMLVKEEKKSLAEAMRLIQEEGQVILDQAIRDQAMKGSGGN